MSELVEIGGVAPLMKMLLEKKLLHGNCITVTGKTLKENNLKESDVICDITSKLVINKIAYKLMNEKITRILNKFKKTLNG
mgnify:CR=1 FL=1